MGLELMTTRLAVAPFAGLFAAASSVCAPNINTDLKLEQINHTQPERALGLA